MERLFLWYFDLPSDSELSGVWRVHHNFDIFALHSWLLLAIFTAGFVVVCIRRYRNITTHPTLLSFVACTSSLCFLCCWGLLIAGTYLTYEIQKRPVLFVFFDTSQSMSEKDHIADRNYLSFVRRLTKKAKQPSRIDLVLQTNATHAFQKLDARFDVRRFLVSGDVKEFTPDSAIDADGNASQLPRLIQETIGNHSDESISGVLVWTDGRIVPNDSRTWSDLSGYLQARDIPLYAVGVGDTKESYDASVGGIVAPDQILPREEFRVSGRVSIAGDHGEQELTVTLQDAETRGVYDQARVELSDAHNETEFTLTTTELPRGMNKILVSLQDIKNDLRPGNNQWLGTVEVVERPFRVLLVAPEPSFDFRHLRSELVQQKGIEVDSYLHGSHPDLGKENPHALPAMPSFDELRRHYHVVVVFGTTGLSAIPGDGVLNFARSGGSVIYVDDAGGSYETHADQASWSELLPYDPRTAIGNPDARLQETQPQVTSNRLLITPDGKRSMLLRYFQRIDTAESQERDGSHWIETPMQPYKSISKDAFSQNSIVLALSNPEKTPIIALKRQGIGLVLWIGMNELWLWKSHRDEESFSKVWMQLLPTMASISRKNFVIEPKLETDRDQYHIGDEILIRAFMPRVQQISANSQEVITIQTTRNGIYHGAHQLVRESPLSNWYRIKLRAKDVGQFEAKIVSRSVFPQLSPRVQFRVLSSHSEQDDMTPEHRDLQQASASTHGQFSRIDKAETLPQNIHALDTPASSPLQLSLLNRVDFLCLCLLLFALEIYFAKVLQIESRRTEGSQE